MGINKWRHAEDGGCEEPDVAQCMMCKELMHEQFGMNFCPFCGTQWDGQLECSSKGRKWHDIVAKYGRSMYDNKIYDRPYWSVQWKPENIPGIKWEKERCYNRRDAVVKYKDRIQRLVTDVNSWEVRLVRVMGDFFIKSVLFTKRVGGEHGIIQQNYVSEVLTK
jgi:hypothetical protein